MDLHIQILFADIYSKFCHETHAPSDIGALIETLRSNKKNISDKAKLILLQIPLCVLNNQVEIEDESAWSNKNGSYFSGNYAQEPLHSKFASTDFDLSTIAESLQNIMSDTTLLNSDFNLRNPEVTLRDDVKVKNYSKFKESGKIFACIMDKAFDL